MAKGHNYSIDIDAIKAEVSCFFYVAIRYDCLIGLWYPIGCFQAG